MMTGRPVARASAYSVSIHCSFGNSDQSSVFRKPPRISAMHGRGTTAGTTEIVLVTRPPAPPRAAACSIAPSLEGGPAAGRIGFAKLRPQTLTLRFAIHSLEYQDLKQKSQFDPCLCPREICALRPGLLGVMTSCENSRTAIVSQESR